MRVRCVYAVPGEMKSLVDDVLVGKAFGHESDDVTLGGGERRRSASIVARPAQPGRMFLLWWKALSGSYLALTSASRR